MATTSETFVQDRRTWNDHIKKYELDVYYEYDYVAIDCKSEDTPELFIYAHDGGAMIYPYVCRRIAGTPYSDTVTAYGYGGPVFVGSWQIEQVAEARSSFVASCRSRSIITETVRFHPLLDNVSLGRSWVEQCRAVQPTTAVDLRRPLAQVLAAIDKRSQRNIRKAEREAVTVRKAGLEELPTFLSMYRETMDKRHAEDRYYFRPDYFNSLFLSDRIDAEFLLAEWEDEVIAGCLVLYGSRFAHYHLGASSVAHLSHRPNHMLFQQMIIEASRRGKEFLHLGGGATADPNDSLLVFKKTFTASHEAMFYLGQSVLDSRAYGTVCRGFLSRYSGAEESGWFPLYRTPLTRLQLTDADGP
jgi:hypothetical protein